MAYSKFTSEDLRNARKAGFKKKKPKKPKTKTYNALSNYQERYNQWVKDLKAAATKGKKLDAMRRELRNL